MRAHNSAPSVVWAYYTVAQRCIEREQRREWIKMSPAMATGRNVRQFFVFFDICAKNADF
ncbi:MAG: hypothetical protein GY820_19915 [Gammaproteobacteria bacterium]|nr:hypothetical protein [Gammaproteobacteria bacterium]